MADEIPDSPYFTLAPLEPEWHPILHAENQVVLYNPTSHALSIRQHPSTPRAASVVPLRRAPQVGGQCPYCHRPMPRNSTINNENDVVERTEIDSDDEYQAPRSQVPNYFQLLQIANETSSVPTTPSSSRRGSTPMSMSNKDEESYESEEHAFRPANMAEGYFKTFFEEECRLGMGANGSVYLCQVSHSDEL
jgi:hypothetical protein